MVWRYERESVRPCSGALPNFTEDTMKIKLTNGDSIPRITGDRIKKVPKGFKLIFSIYSNSYFVVKA